MKNILLTGGAGYVGSHTVLELAKAGYNPITYDNLSNGNEEAILEGELVVGDLCDEDCLNRLFRKRDINAVVHLAASVNASKSILKRDLYIQNNYRNSLTLVKTMLENKVTKLVFSSSAAIYGDQKEVPIAEEAQVKPKNPYAESKAMFETALKDFKHESFRYVILRYFNAAGADLEERLCFETSAEPSLIKAAVQSALYNRQLHLYGTDYDTTDGTCIRDYVHVNDLARAHVLALNYLFNGGKSAAFNLGGGKGYSNRQIVEIVKKITEVNFKVKEAKRRQGDIVVSVASIDKAKSGLDWEPKLGLQSIIETTIKCQQKLKSGLQ